MRSKKVLFLGVLLLSLALAFAFGCDRTQVFTLTVTVEPEGAGEVEPAGGEFEEDTSVTLEVTTEEGYYFLEWGGEHGDEVALDENEEGWKILMNEDKEITAVFSDIEPIVLSIPASLQVEVGESEELQVTVDPEDADLSFASSDETIAEVDEDGEITALEPGDATITVTATKENYLDAEDEVEVRVVKTLAQVDQPEWDENQDIITWEDVDYAISYEVTLYHDSNLETSVTVDSGVEEYDFSDIILHSGPGSYQVRVLALGDGTYIFDGKLSEFSQERIQADEFSGGDGTKNDPYQVQTAWQLDKVREHLDDPDVHFVQIAHIDLSDYSEGEGWEPIGVIGDYFRGEYDGNDHIISNLTISRPEDNFMGLFGFAANATIKNVGLENIDVEGDSHTGGLVGEISSGSIINCYVAGKVTGKFEIGGLMGHLGNNSKVLNCHATANVSGVLSHVGGLIGATGDSAEVRFSYATGNVAGNNSVGGLIGYLWENTTVEYSFATGNVEGNNRVGGLVGHNEEGCNINNCYSTGTVTGNDRVGGLVGYNEEGSINYCYSTGKVTGDTNKGGLMGENAGDSLASYWDTDTSETTESDGGEGRTTAQMQAGTPGDILDEEGEECEHGDLMYDGWSEGTWNFGGIYDYPWFYWQQ